MATIKRKSVPKHVVIVDTNIVWHNDKSKTASPEFENFWETHVEQFELELVLPEVVAGELLYRQTTSALNALDKANDSLDKVAAITSRQYSNRITPERVRGHVRARFNSWITDHSARVVKTPCATIDWDEVVGAAIWRKAPFEEAKERGSEKGFRDHLIMETAIS